MFSKRLKELRIKKGLTLEQVAKGVGTTKSYVHSLETKGPSRPTVNTVYKLAAFFHVNPEYLMGQEKLEDAQDKEFYASYLRRSKAIKAKIRAIAELL